MESSLCQEYYEITTLFKIMHRDKAVSTVCFFIKICVAFYFYQAVPLRSQKAR